MQAEFTTIEFDFVDENGEITDPKFADFIVAFFDCACGFTLRFQKSYERVPLHYESLLKKCRDVTCPKCRAKYRHGESEEGEDAVFQFAEPIYVNPNQLTLLI